MRRAAQAALLALALVVTSGCALLDRAGAAAVVDGERYTDEQLARDFAALDQALGDQAKPATMDAINRNFITLFIGDKVMAKAVQEQGVEPDKVAIGKLHRSLVKQTGGEEQLRTFAASRGIPPSMLWTVLRNSVLTTDLGAKLIGGTNTDAQDAAANAYLKEVAAGMNIEVAPRYGVWDATQLYAAEPVDDLSKVAAAIG